MAQSFFCKINGGIRGPFSSHQLRRMANAGKLLPDSLIRLDGTDKWIAAGKINNLEFSQPEIAVGSESDHRIPFSPKLNQTVCANCGRELGMFRGLEGRKIICQHCNKVTMVNSRAKALVPVARLPFSNPEAVVAEIVEEDVTNYRTAPPSRGLAPWLLVVAGVGGTLLMVGVVSLGVFLFGSKENAAQSLINSKSQGSVWNENSAQVQDIPNPQRSSSILVNNTNNPPKAALEGNSPSPILELSSPVAVVKAYMAAITWEGRLPFVLTSEQVRPQMAQHYKNTKISPENYMPGNVVSTEGPTEQIGKNCFVTIDVSTSSPKIPRVTYVVVRTQEGYKVDWMESQMLIKKGQDAAFQREIKDLNPIIEFRVLKWEQVASYAVVDIELTNKSKALISYAQVAMNIHNAKSDYIGNNFTNDTNFRAGQSILKKINFNNVKYEEVKSWKLTLENVMIDQGSGQKVNATNFFSLKEKPNSLW